MPSYAQTNLQLYNQLRAEGFSEEDRTRIRDGYALTMRLFSGLYRPSGKPFINHLIGTASILARHGASGELIAAGLLHGAYSRGDFGSLSTGVSTSKRETVRQVIGARAEKYVYRYTRLPWSKSEIQKLRDRVASLEPLQRDLLRMRLANELEDHLNLGLVHASESDRRLAYFRWLVPILEDIAEVLGHPELAAELRHVHDENEREAQCTLSLPTIRTNEAEWIAPPSYRKRLTAQLTEFVRRGVKHVQWRLG